MPRVYVGGIAWATNEDSLRDAFGRFGEVVSAVVVSDRETGRSRGFGFVEFAEQGDAEKAVTEMNGQDLDGRNIRVDHATERRDQGAGGRPPRKNFDHRRSNDRGGDRYQRRDDYPRRDNYERRPREDRSRSPRRRDY
ncbi:hypothetical protein EDD86DRAFT_248223 [Gorgonomyces haynaldii]|nr:hypothetical protein EDD86DRAFT_248223 [Gorgonomyces haynaldii]